MGSRESKTHDIQHWLDVRRLLRSSRRELSARAADLYPYVSRVGSTALLTRPEWIPEAPVALGEVMLSWSARDLDTTSLVDASQGGLPLSDSGPIATYAQAVEAIDRPRLLVNRPCYRLTAAEATAVGYRLGFGPGGYFDVLNIGEAVAHEFAAAGAGGFASAPRLPLREAVGDPTIPSRRPMLTAITTLTIRHDRQSGAARFFAHWRDPERVATNGDLLQLTPVGMFQPAGMGLDRMDDFDLWRCMVREYSEELLGHPEHGEVAYGNWSFYVELAEARRAGRCRPWFLGIGVDPLNLATDILTAVVFESTLFDTVFADIVAENDEGQTDPDGVPFTAERVGDIVRSGRMQPAGAATLELAMTHKDVLLGQ